MQRLTIRARLTLVYGGIFLAAGAVLLGLTYALASTQAPREIVSKKFEEVPGGDTKVSTVPPQDSLSPLPGDAPMIISGTEIKQDAQDVLGAVLTQGAIALVIVSAVAIVLGWLIAGRVLQPLQKVTDTAHRIAHSPAADRGLHERISLDGPRDEVKKLADTFDLMLERLDHSFDGQRTFIANASHELRTPLTLNRALLEVATQRRAASPEIIQLGETLMEINARHERLIDGLLMLARSEPEVNERSYVDLADIVEHVASQQPPGKVELRTEVREAPTSGNPVLLERLVQNLVENGIRYNVPDEGWVRVESGIAADGTSTVVVTNTGPIVPRYEIPTLFEPFRRLGTERLANGSPGAGLGLSIVRSVARAHGGDVQAEPHIGGGLIVTVTLPCPSS